MGYAKIIRYIKQWPFGALKIQDMKKINRSKIHPVKMSTNPPDEIVNCGMRVINTNGFIYEYVGIGWIKTDKATKKDFQEIPELTD